MAFAAVNVLNQALERKVSAPMPECYFMHHSSQLWAKFRLLKQTLDFFRSTFSTFQNPDFSGPFWHNIILNHGQNSRSYWNHCLLLSPFMDSTQDSTAPLYIPWHAPVAYLVCWLSFKCKWLKKHNKTVHKAKTEFTQQTSRACYHEAGAINSVTYWHYIKCGKYSCCQTLTEP